MTLCFASVVLLLLRLLLLRVSIFVGERRLVLVAVVPIKMLLLVMHRQQRSAAASWVVHRLLTVVLSIHLLVRRGMLVVNLLVTVPVRVWLMTRLVSVALHLGRLEMSLRCGWVVV